MMHISYPNSHILQIRSEILGHFFGEGGHQHPFVFGCSGLDLLDKVINLPLHRAHLNAGVQQSRGTNHLLHNLARAGSLVFPRGGRDVDHLVDPLGKLVKFQRSVVKGTGQAEAISHQAFLPGSVAVIHGPHLGQSHMAFVNKQHKILGKVVQQRMGRRAHRPPFNDPAVIFDSRAVAQLLHHLNIIHGALLKPLRLHQLVFRFKIGDPRFHLPINELNGAIHFFFGGDVVGGGPNGDVIEPPDGGTCHHIDFADAVDLISEKFHTDGSVLPIRGPDLQSIPPHPHHVSLKSNVISLIADGNEPCNQLIPLHLRTHPQSDHHFFKILRLAQAVDTGDRGHHNDIPPLHQRGGGRQAQPVNFLIDRGILFNKCVRVRYVGLRLVIIIIGNKILHRVVGKKLLKLRAQLGRKGLVVGQHQGGALHLLDDLGHGKRLPRAGYPQKRLLLQAMFYAGRQRRNGRRLVSRRCIFADQLKFFHPVHLKFQGGFPCGKPESTRLLSVPRSYVFCDWHSSRRSLCYQNIRSIATPIFASTDR